MESGNRFACEEPADRAMELLECSGRQERRNLPDDFALRPAKHLLGGSIPFSHPAGGVHREDGHGCRLDQRLQHVGGAPKLLLVSGQCLLGGALLRDVLDQADGVTWSLAATGNVGGGDLSPEHRPVPAEIALDYPIRDWPAREDLLDDGLTGGPVLRM